MDNLYATPLKWAKEIVGSKPRMILVVTIQILIGFVYIKTHQDFQPALLLFFVGFPVFYIYALYRMIHIIEKKK